MPRKTIHLVQRGLEKFKCLVCSELITAGTPICVNRSDWDTVYVNHSEFRRCTDGLDRRDKPKLKMFPLPTQPGFFWAEWRIAEDGTWPEGQEHIMSMTPEVVHVVVNLEDSVESDVLIALVPGIDKQQLIENFVWRSDRLEIPKSIA